MTLRLLDTFSGIGGFSYAAERLVGGYQTVAFVEREPFCQSILRKHWSDVPIYDDITTFNPEPGSADVVCGGFPCQDISTAGKQAGIKEGTRSGLFYELMRVVRLVGPRYIVLENVAAILANGLDTVLGELAEAGFDAEWACIPASAVGACHQRDRWWLVAYASGPNQTGRAEGLGRRQRGATDAGGCGISKGGRSASSAADTSHLLSNGQPIGHAGESKVRAFSQFGNSGGKGDAPPAILLEMLECRHKAASNANDQGPQRKAVTGIQGKGVWSAPPGRLDPDWRSYVSEPVLCRGDDGLSGRVDRLKALGNAVVPQVAAIPLARVLELERVRATDPAAHPPCP